MGLSLATVLSVAGCEDGPNNPYVSDNSRGTASNDGNGKATVDPGKQGFDSQSAGTNKQEICTGEEKAKRWAKMVQQPVTPPRLVGGLDLAGDDTWKGLTIDAAEQILCQSTNDGDDFGDGTQVNYWGDNQELLVDYTVSNRKINFALILPGYLGTVDATSRDGHDTFKIPVITQMTKNGQNYTIDWNNPTKFAAEVNEIYDAMLATYAPGLPPDPDCIGSGACISGDFGDIAFFGFGALGLFLWVENKNAAQPAASKFNRIDIYLTKTLPFSLANPMLKLDAEGPVAKAGKLGTSTQDCDVKIGLSFGDFLSRCVKVTNDAAKNDTEYNKLIGGRSHSTERFSFDVQGIDLNFSDKNLDPDSIVKDNDTPDPTDLATEFQLDQSTLGVVVNDHQDNDPTKPRDLHGAGLVYLEYARIVQDRLSQYVDPANRRVLGDPNCLAPMVDPTNPVYPDGCTGFEGFLTAAPPTGDPITDVLTLGHDVTLVNPTMELGLKPGHPQVTFCIDPNGDLNTGYTTCPVTGDLWSTSYERVLDVMGKGKVANLPIEARDVRFFWKAYFTALVKYFFVAGTADENDQGVHAQVVDPNNLFFDSVGAGQFEIGEYVDRRFASKTRDPIDLVISADVKNGIFSSYDFSNEVYRGETLLYSAVQEDQSKGIGQEDTGLLTNVFGNTLLRNSWFDSSAGKSAYYCATHIDPGNCDGQLPPLNPDGTLELDEIGRPRLAGYPGSFGSSYSALALGPSPVTIIQTFDAIEQAKVSMPRYTDPYDATSAPLPPLEILVPWAPKQPGEGYPVALTGEIDRFVEAYQLDLSGTTVSANINYDFQVDPYTGLPYGDGSLEFKAVETRDFLGEVFLCRDDVTGDLLGVRMYTPVAEILDWLVAHPSQFDACGIIIRYSPYNNYVDYITTLTNGVRLGITQGGGFGRVVDVTLFVPGE